MYTFSHIIKQHKFTCNNLFICYIGSDTRTISDSIWHRTQLTTDIRHLVMDRPRRRNRHRGRGGSNRGRDSYSAPNSPLVPATPVNNNSPVASIADGLDEARYDFAEGEENIDEQGNNTNNPLPPPLNQQAPPVAVADVNPNQAVHGILLDIRRQLLGIQAGQSRTARRLDTMETRMDRLEALQNIAQTRSQRVQQDLPARPQEMRNIEPQRFKVEDKHFPSAIKILTGSGDPSAEDWTTDVREFIRNQEPAWTEVMAKQVFYFRTSGSVYKHLTRDFGISRHSFDEILAEIVKKFGGGNQEMVNSLLLKSMQQQDNESVMEYFSRFYDIASKIMSRSDIDKMHDYLSGLRRDIQEAVFNKQPTSLQMANELAKNAEAWIAMYGKKKTFVKPSTPVQNTTVKPFFYSKSNGQSPQRTAQNIVPGSTPNTSARVMTTAMTHKTPQATTPKTPTTGHAVKRLEYNTPYRPQQFNNIDAEELDLSENYVLPDEELAPDQENEALEE